MSKSPSDDDVDRIRAAIFAGRKIEAIKLYRQSTSQGLEEAKDFIESLESELRRSAPEKFTAAPAAKGCTLVSGGIGFVVFGALMISWGIVEWWPRWSRISDCQRTQGTVVKLLNDEEGTLVPVVEFQVGDKTYRIRGQVPSSPSPYSVGESVPVLYEPHKPQEGMIDSFWDHLFIPLVLGGFGSIFGSIGVGMLRFSRCRPRLTTG
jgi:hypothetical protein